MAKNSSAPTADHFAEQAVAFKLGSRIDLIETLFKDFHLHHYYAAYLDSNIWNSTSLFYTPLRDMSFVMNTYEGALHLHCTREKSRVLLLAALFSRFRYRIGGSSDNNMMEASFGFDDIHRSISTDTKTKKSALTNEEAFEVRCLIKATYQVKAWSPAKFPEKAILGDARAMWRYHTVQPQLNRFLVGFHTDIIPGAIHVDELPSSDETRWKDHANSAINHPWSTRWAKMKNVSINFPKKDLENAARAKELIKNFHSL